MTGVDRRSYASVSTAATRVRRWKLTRQGACKLRKACRWLEVDPTITSEVDLRPAMGVGASNDILFMFHIVGAVGIAHRDARGNAQRARHHRHSRGEVVAETIMVRIIE